MSAALGQVIAFRADPDLGDAIEVAAKRRGQTVSDYMRRVALADTGFEAAPYSEPEDDDADLIICAARGLAGAGLSLIERAATASADDRDKLLRLLVAFVVYESAPIPCADNLRSSAELVEGKIARKAGNA